MVSSAYRLGVVVKCRSRDNDDLSELLTLFHLTIYSINHQLSLHDEYPGTPLANDPHPVADRSVFDWREEFSSNSRSCFPFCGLPNQSLTHLAAATTLVTSHFRTD